MSNPKNEYGKVIITPDKHNEFKPKLATDECWTNENYWKEVRYGGDFYPIYTYRRAIQPGEGFEIVAEGESQTIDMEYTFDGIKWIKNNDVWYKRPVISHGFILAFRRPIKQSFVQEVSATQYFQASPNPWRLMSNLEGLPEDNEEEVMTVHIMDGKQFNNFYEAGEIRAGRFPSCITHWQPIAPIPKPPKVMTESEALQELTDNYSANRAEFDLLQRGWKAAMKFVERGGK